MKWLREEVEIMVIFRPGIMRPVCFKYEGDKKNIIKVNRIWEERRGLHNCKFFLCQTDDNHLVELKWDMDDTKWFLEKL